MTPSPERRQRILQAQQLNQRGHPIGEIAKQLDTSTAAVHADLRLYDEAFPQIAQVLAHDHILEQVEYTAQQLRQLAASDPLEPLFKYAQLQDDHAAPLVEQVSASDIIRLYAQHRNAMIALLREHRFAVEKLESAAARREIFELIEPNPNANLNPPQHYLTELEPLQPDSEPAPEPAEQPNPPSRAQRRRAEAAERKARKKNLRQHQQPVAAG